MALTSLVLVGGAARASATPVFANGDFEAGVSTGWDVMTATNTPGWTINYGTGATFPRLNLNQACHGPFGNNNSGCQFATIGGVEDGGTSSLAQTLSGFTVGDAYELTWLQSSEYVHADQLRATIIGNLTQSQDFASNPYPGGGDFWFGWQTMTYNFVADATTLTFQFQSALGGANYEIGFDKAGLENTSVPEPATLLLLGTGLVGVVRRRRTKKAQ